MAVLNRWNRSAEITVASIGLVAVVFTWFVWQRRWIADDGLIYTRIVRQILDGNGPVFNAFERAESNTSTLWPWLLALFGSVIRINLAHLAVLLGGLSSIAGLVIAMDATRRWHRLRGSDAMLVPCTALFVLGVTVFWEYATSGLETGLTTLWLGATWWALVTLRAAPARERVTAILFGLGPLVRPDLAVVSAVFLGAGWLLVRPTRRRTLILVAYAIALPLAYEVFRAGFYGTLVPLPAIAKSATNSQWARGLDYVRDFAQPYRIWLPLGVCAGLLGYVVRTRPIATRDRVLLTAPLVSAALLMLYLIRVGGDFMHARMCLPAMFLAIAPGLVVPLRRFTVPAVVVIAGWAIVTGYALNDRKSHSTSPLITDERYGYVLRTGSKHPIDERPFIRAQRPAATMLADALAAGRRIMISESAVVYAISPALRESAVYIAGRLGSGGALTPVDGIAADVLGLANPLGARITMTYPTEPPGHQKLLPWPWLLADFADPAQDGNAPDDTPGVLIRAARHAMSCGELAELLRSVREPLTWSRFWANLTGSIRRTRLVIPSDPIDAERVFCGAATSTPKVAASSSYEKDRWSMWNAIDGRPTVPGESLGYSTALGRHEDHAEWIELQFPVPRSVSKVVLQPRTDPGNEGVGFPIDFRIQTWDGSRWTDRVTHTGYEISRGTTFTWSPAITTDRVRVLATRLQTVGIDGYVMQLAEIEAFP